MQFTIGVIDFSEPLQQMKKEAIASKLLDSAIGVSSMLQSCKLAEKDSDSKAYLQKAAKHISNTVYWLDQCQKSENYPHNAELLNHGKQIQSEINLLLQIK